MRKIIMFASLVFLSSCAELSHLDEALTLKDYSDEKDAQAVSLDAQNKKFDEMVVLIKNGDSLAAYPTKASFTGKFGAPVLDERITLPDGSEGERYLYRHATEYFNGPKVYVIFDKQGKVLKIDPQLGTASADAPAH